MFDTYSVEVLVDRLVGGIPIVPDGSRVDVYARWLKTQGVVGDDNAELTARLAGDTEIPDAVDEWPLQGFRRDPDGFLYVEARQVKAMLKEAAQRLGFIQKVRGSRQVLQHDLHVRSADDNSQRLLILRALRSDGAFLMMEAPDEVAVQPISVVTPQGRRNTIKRSEVCHYVTLRFRVLVLAGGVGVGLIDEARLRLMFELGQFLGVGADRSQGAGTFTLISLNVVPSWHDLPNPASVTLPSEPD